MSELPSDADLGTRDQQSLELIRDDFNVPYRDVIEAALRSGMVALSQELTDTESLEASLTDVARITVRAIFGSDGAGVTLLEDNRNATIVASDPFVREIDKIQYGIGQGPCVTAVEDDVSVRSGSLLSDKRWPQFASRIGNLGVGSASSVMSLPLRVPGHLIGSLNVYAHAKDAFFGDSLRRGEDFAAAAAVAVRNMHTLALTKRHAVELETALKSRPTIDQAIGIIRSRTGGTAAEAFDALRVISQRENRKLSVVSEELVERSSSRARARHAPHE